MTKEEFKVRYDKYVKKAEYYRRKADKLEQEFFEEQNKDCRLFKYLNEICREE